MRTRITELLGIRYPIIQGGMQWVGKAELAAGRVVGLIDDTPPCAALTERIVEDCRQHLRRAAQLAQA